MCIRDSNYTGRWRLKTTERLVCRDSSYRGSLDQEEMETVSCEMESWVAEADVNIMEACKVFTRKLFFGVSTKEPALRVEDPLLWILSPVSYTRLDVYKRQERNAPWILPGERA